MLTVGHLEVQELASIHITRFGQLRTEHDVRLQSLNFNRNPDPSHDPNSEPEVSHHADPNSNHIRTIQQHVLVHQSLRSLLNMAGAGAVLLLEDVDAAFIKREANPIGRHLTFSGVALGATCDLGPRCLP